MNKIECFEPDQDALYHPGETIAIRWRFGQGHVSQNVQIKVYEATDNLTRLQLVRPHRFGVIERRTPASTGEYLWRVPSDFPRGEYLKITVTDTLNDEIEDQSYAFQILPGVARPPHITTQDFSMGTNSANNSSSSSSSSSNNPWQLDAFYTAMKKGAASASTSAEEDLRNAFSEIGHEATMFLINMYGNGDQSTATQKLLRMFVENMMPAQNAQRDRSRSVRIDDFTAWPPPGLTRDSSPESELHAEGFVSGNEVELRRIAQLADPRFQAGTDIVRFCAGGMQAEKTHVLSRLIVKW